MEKKSQKFAQELVEKLANKGLKITTAESCTGGGLGQVITSIPGSSKVFGYGFITYSDSAKNQLLGVSWDLLKHQGAVSAKVAQSLAVGALKVSQADLAVSITGFAGPDGDLRGLVFIGLAQNDYTRSYQFQFEGDREEVREMAIQEALELALYSLNNDFNLFIEG